MIRKSWIIDCWEPLPLGSLGEARTADGTLVSLTDPKIETVFFLGVTDDVGNGDVKGGGGRS